MGRKPLEGYRVLDLSEIIAGPYCSSILGAMGADVIKVERYGKGDNYRYTDKIFPEWNSSYFVGINHSKRDIALDLKNPKGHQILAELISKSDVFIENMRPAAVRKLGIDYDKVRSINSKIIYCSLTAFGEGGPMMDLPGMDITVQAISGIMGITGDPDGGPAKVGAPICDILAGLSLSNAIVIALLDRERSGMGQKIEINLLNAQIAALSSVVPGYFATGKEVQRAGSGHPDLVPYQAFATADGYVIVGCLNEKFWQNLCVCLDKKSLIEDERFCINTNRVKHREELLEILNPIFKGKSTAQWLEILEQQGIPCSPVNTVGQAMNNPQLSVNNMLVDLEHPLAGKIRILGLPFKLCGTPGEITVPAPLHGQHTGEILREMGYEEAAIEKLIQDQVVEWRSVAQG